jgi:hypothetical protein
MASLPRPLIALLVATVAAFGLWYVELKPSSSSGGGSQGVGSYQSAINKAHQAVKTSNAANARLGAPTSTGPAPSSPTPAKTAAPNSAKTATPNSVKTATPNSAKTTTTATNTAAKTTATKTAAAKPTAKIAKTAATAPSVAQQVTLINNALTSHKVIAVLFYNDAAADDQAMAHELRAVPTHKGQVVKLAVPVSQLTSFAMITQQVPVVTAPTLVLIDASRQATTITGFADPLEITERVDDALAAR